MPISEIIADYEDFLSTYEHKWWIIKQQYIKQFFPILKEDPRIEDYAYILGKLIGDGNLDKNFTM